MASNSNEESMSSSKCLPKPNTPLINGYQEQLSYTTEYDHSYSRQHEYGSNFAYFHSSDHSEDMARDCNEQPTPYEGLYTFHNEETVGTFDVGDQCCDFAE